MASYSLEFVKILNRDGAALSSAALVAFSKDYWTFLKSNDRKPAMEGAALLKNNDQGNAIKAAIVAGEKAGNVAVGHIGSAGGSLEKDDKNAEALSSAKSALERYSEAFKASLDLSGAFSAPVPKTQEEKAQAKADKADKQTEALATLINAKIVAGELVRSIDVRAFPQEELDSLKAHIEALQTERDTLAAENATLKSTIATLSAPVATKSKALKTA